MSRNNWRLGLAFAVTTAVMSAVATPMAAADGSASAFESDLDYCVAETALSPIRR